MIIKEYYEPYLAYIKAKGRNPKTIEEHKRFLYGPLAGAIGEMELSNFRKVDVALLEEAGRSFGESGPQRAVVVLRRLLNYIEDRGEAIPFPWRNISLPKIPVLPVESLNEGEVRAILDTFDSSCLASLRTRALLEILLDSGMRISEVISLNKQDIDWKEKEATVTNVKTHRVQKVYFTDRSLEWLKKYLDKRKDNLECLFVTGRARMASCTARNYLRVHTAHLNFRKHIRHHIFRKTFTTDLLRNGLDIKTVQYLARHESERTTLKYYVSVDTEKAKVAHQRVMATRYRQNYAPTAESAESMGGIMINSLTMGEKTGMLQPA